MNTSEYEKSNKISDISISNTSTNPRAMMIMNLYTQSTLAAMKRPRRP
jgi:hypothetical protein